MITDGWFIVRAVARIILECLEPIQADVPRRTGQPPGAIKVNQHTSVRVAALPS